MNMCLVELAYKIKIHEQQKCFDTVQIKTTQCEPLFTGVEATSTL